jgi:hypothetical protein
MQGDHDWPSTPVKVPVDVAGVRRDMDAIRSDAERAGHAIEATLLRAVRTGKLGFDDLRRTALSVLGQIAAQALRGGLDSLFGDKGAAGSIGAALGKIIHAPGRATGGPVSPARPYWVGEQGPELFVPTASGRIERTDSGARTVNVAIRVQADAGAAPEALRRSSRQVARAVRAALAEDA